MAGNHLFAEGQRIVSTHTGMVGTVRKAWNTDVSNWYEVDWDGSACTEDELAAYHEDQS